MNNKTCHLNVLSMRKKYSVRHQVNAYSLTMPRRNNIGNDVRKAILPAEQDGKGYEAFPKERLITSEKHWRQPAIFPGVNIPASSPRGQTAGLREGEEKKNSRITSKTLRTSIRTLYIELMTAQLSEDYTGFSELPRDSFFSLKITCHDTLKQHCVRLRSCICLVISRTTATIIFKTL